MEAAEKSPVECPRCHGDGFVSVATVAGYDKEFILSHVPIDGTLMVNGVKATASLRNKACPTCQGSGRVEVGVSFPVKARYLVTLTGDKMEFIPISEHGPN